MKKLLLAVLLCNTLFAENNTIGTEFKITAREYSNHPVPSSYHNQKSIDTL